MRVHAGVQITMAKLEGAKTVVVGGKKTVLMHRWEKRTRENAEPPRSGCGVNFERESTTPAKGCERGTGHYRIIQYVSITTPGFVH